MSCLKATLTESIGSQVLGSSTSAEIWSNLEITFQQQSFAKKNLLRNQLQTIKKGNDSISDYLHKIKHISDSLAAINLRVDDDELIMNTLNDQLGNDYENLVMLIENRTTKISFQEVKAWLLNHE